MSTSSNREYLCYCDDDDYRKKHKKATYMGQKQSSNPKDNISQERPKKNGRGRELEYSGKFPPPEPPMGDYGNWELQFCKWWGWTWVKKNTGNESDGCCPCVPDEGCPRRLNTVGIGPSSEHFSSREKLDGENKSPKNKKRKERKKRGPFFGCFKRDKDQKKSNAETADGDRRRRRDGRPNSYYDDSSSSTSQECCCCCNQVCCPCAIQTCCQCKGDGIHQDQSNCCELKHIETQTRKATSQHNKICQCTPPSQAKHDISVQCYCGKKKHRHNKGRHCKVRRVVCCPCQRSVCCCPCQRQTCCPCSTNNRLKSTQRDNANVVQSNLALIKYSNPYNLKPLDLLLKNPQSLFKTSNKHPKGTTVHNFLAVSESFVSLDNHESTHNKKTEHCNILAAVCDAILSNHKFENGDKNPLHSILKTTASRQSQNSDNSDCAMSFNVTSGFNGRRNKQGGLEKILTNKAKLSRGKSIGEVSVQTAEANAQSDETADKTENFSQTDARNKTNAKVERKKCSVDSPRKSKIPLKVPQIEDSTSMTNPAFERISDLLNTIDQSLGQTTGAQVDTPAGTSGANYLELLRTSQPCRSIFQRKKSVHLLDATTPPFTDSEAVGTTNQHR